MCQVLFLACERHYLLDLPRNHKTGTIRVSVIQQRKAEVPKGWQYEPRFTAR